MAPKSGERIKSNTLKSCIGSRICESRWTPNIRTVTKMQKPVCIKATSLFFEGATIEPRSTKIEVATKTQKGMDIESHVFPPIGPKRLE